MDVQQLCLVNLGRLLGFVVPLNEEAHPDEAEGTYYYKCHFPTEGLCQWRNHKRSGKCTDRGTGIEY